MDDDGIMQMDRELMVQLRHAGTVADRERLVIENLRRKGYGSKVCATAGPCDLASAKQIASEIKLDLKALDN